MLSTVIRSMSPSLQVGMTTLNSRSTTALALACGHRLEHCLRGVDHLPALLGRHPEPLGELGGVAGGKLVQPANAQLLEAPGDALELRGAPELDLARVEHRASDADERHDLDLRPRADRPEPREHREGRERCETGEAGEDREPREAGKPRKEREPGEGGEARER